MEFELSIIILINDRNMHSSVAGYLIVAARVMACVNVFAIDRSGRNNKMYGIYDVVNTRKYLCIHQQ